MDYELPTIPYLKIKFILAALQDCRLPRIKGSMLRGAFGHALRSTVCVMQAGQECRNCLLRGQCVFTKIFEIFIQGEPPPFLKGVLEAPKPFIIDPYDVATDYKENEALEFAITLLGRACEYNPYIIFAVSKMCEHGLSARRFPFKCLLAYWYKDGEERMLYRGDTQCLCEAAKPSLPEVDGAFSLPLTLKFLTPTRLKFQNRYTMDFTFRTLTFKMLQRILELAHFHVPDAHPLWEFHDYLNQADKVSITNKNLSWDDWPRYSNRQSAKMEMGGFFGDITLHGDIGPFTQLLRMSEIVHVGKGTSFGLGKIGL